MQLGISEKGGLLASIEVRATFIEEIKDKQFEDENLNELKKMTAMGKAQKTTLQHPEYQPKHQPFPRSFRDVCCQSIILTDFVPGKVYQLRSSLVSFLKH